MTRLIYCPDQIIVKAELDNPGGSHKYRAARHIIEKAIENREIIPGKTTVIEKTGGNFGFGLIVACNQCNVDIDLAVGLSFSQRKRDLLEFFGARLIGKKMLADGLTPKEIVQYHLDQQESLGKEYFYTDQFQNSQGVDAHQKQTGVELVNQLHQQGIKDKIVFVSCAGTGASFTGITLALRNAGFDVCTILVEPAGCDMRANIFSDHRIEGASVGVVAPFLDWNLIDDTKTVSLEELFIAQRWFWKYTGIFIGNSSAATIAVARNVRLNNHFKDVPIVTLAYDSGLWYEDYLLAK